MNNLVEIKNSRNSDSHFLLIPLLNKNLNKPVFPLKYQSFANNCPNQINKFDTPGCFSYKIQNGLFVFYSAITKGFH